MIASPLSWYATLDERSVRGFQDPVSRSVYSWVFERSALVHDIHCAVPSAACHVRMVRSCQRPDCPEFDIVKLDPPEGLFHQDIQKLKQIAHDWISFGWRTDSTMLRALLAISSFLKALQAESYVAKRHPKRAPNGFLVVHNTRIENSDSIIRHGISIRFSRSGKGIWARCPSYGEISRTRFRGSLSLLLDISGLCLTRSNGYEVVVGENIPLGRVVRIFDIEKRKEA